MYKALFTILLLLSSVVPSLGQWKQIQQFDNDVFTIFFLDTSFKSNNGFVSTTMNQGSKSSSIWKTADNGKNWHKVAFTVPPLGVVNDFAFKDSLIGWFSVLNYSGFNSWCYKTLDGGETWFPVINLIPSYEGAWGIHYIASLKKLILTLPLVGIATSLDEGNNWSYDYSVNNSLGLSFFSEFEGFSSPGPTVAVITNDGGMTWKNSNPFVEESYQPLAIQNSQIAITSCEHSRSIYLSVDKGLNWNLRYKFNDRLTGCAKGDLSHIIVQTTTAGVYFSRDTGQSWISFCGPSNEADTRFWVKGDSIYMGDFSGNLWLNTTGIGSNSTPQITATTVSFGASCNARDTVIRFTYFDSCSGTQAKLVSASISGSNNFSLLAPFDNPRTIHPDDSLVVHYDPHNINDTAKLQLRFHLGFIDVDTTIILTATATAHQDVTFALQPQQMITTAADDITLSIVPSKALSNIGLQQIDFDLEYYGDLLHYLGIESSSGTATNTTITRTGRTETIPITITGSNLSLDPTNPIVRLGFQAMLTDTTASVISIKNLRLNNGDANYAQCNLTASVSDGTVQVNLLCGDTLLLEYLKHRRVPLQLVSLTPNPTSNDITITFNSATDQPVMIQIVDVLGNVISERTITSHSGKNEETFLLNAHSGVLYARLSSGGEVVTGKFVKQ